MKFRIVVAITIIATGLQFSSLAFAEEEIIEREVEIMNGRGETIKAFQFLTRNNDGTFTVKAVEPEQEVMDFLSQACRDDHGPNAQYEGFKGMTISESAVFGYSCDIIHSH